MSDGIVEYVSAKQFERQTAEKTDSLLGRHPSKPPHHFTRVLYIPRHDKNTSFLPLYEIGDRYRQSMGETPIGSSLYTVQLGLMPKPQGEGLGATIAYNVNLEQTENGGGVVWAQRIVPLGTQDPASQVIIGSSLDEGCSLILRFPGSSDSTLMRMATSFPIPPTIRKKHTIPHPYFSFSRPGEKPKVYQWQIHPVQHGPLRYTLVDLGASPSSASVPFPLNLHGEEPGILAIYHHAGLCDSLSQSHSEGVLLLPEPVGREQTAWEGAVVASLMGMLWQLRTIDVNKSKTSEKKRRWNLSMHKVDNDHGIRV